MDNDNFSFLADAESSITGDKTEGYTPKEQELIHQLVQERLGKKNAIEFESLDDYVVPNSVCQRSGCLRVYSTSFLCSVRIKSEWLWPSVRKKKSLRLNGQD